MENDWVHKRSFWMPLLMCLNEEKAKYVLREPHEGICGIHAVRASLTLNALMNGYF